jgi:putative PEP-CTERM system histidine kinase
MLLFGIASYAIAAVVYGAVTVILLMSHPGGRRATRLAFATGASTLWAGGIALLLVGRLSLSVLIVLDVLHIFVWTACVLSWLAPAQVSSRFLTGRYLLGLSGLFAVWALFASLTFPSGSDQFGTVFLALLGMGFIGLLVVEQVFRNAQESQRRRLRLMCIGIGGIFIVDVFVYSQAALLDGFVPYLWEGRGLANAVLGPLLVIGIKRQAEWERELFVSRQVVFYTASLLGVGGYLLTMGAVAYIIRAIGAEWSFILELLFLVAAFGLLLVVMFSASIKARFKVFLVKHFYRNKYDYRQEWLRLTQRLGQSGDPGVLAAHALKALALIVGARRGALWLARDGQRYEWMWSLDLHAAPGRAYEKDDAIVRFLASKGWVIDSEEYAREPDRYQTAFGSPANHVLPQGSIVVPLDCQGFLQGFVILEKPAEVGGLNFEDHDILKTAGKQVAVVLAQALTLEKLAETRQFEAMSKMSTYLMHDLKNVLAQQQLVVSNATRFRHRPEFIDDAIATIRSGVERMRRVLEQLQGVPQKDVPSNRADVSKVLIEVRSHCADREPIPEVDVSHTAAWVNMDREKLTSILTHLVRNAQDATPPEGRVSVTLSTAVDHVVITVADTGCGMDQVFLRDRLFRPFDSTKGAHGMGIGAYQVRDTVRSAGGDVEVTSAPNAGTVFRLRLPSADNVVARDKCGLA